MGSKIVKSVTGAVSDVFDGAAKAVGSAAKSVGKGLKRSGKAFIKSPGRLVSSLAKGDIVGAVNAGMNMATYGSLGLTDGAVNAEKLGLSLTSPKAKAQENLSAVNKHDATYRKSTGLLQLRHGKGGGSYSDVARYPLGGNSGKTGSSSGKMG